MTIMNSVEAMPKAATRMIRVRMMNMAIFSVSAPRTGCGSSPSSSWRKGRAQVFLKDLSQLPRRINILDFHLQAGDPLAQPQKFLQGRDAGIDQGAVDSYMPE